MIRFIFSLTKQARVVIFVFFIIPTFLYMCTFSAVQFYLKRVFVFFVMYGLFNYGMKSIISKERRRYVGQIFSATRSIFKTYADNPNTVKRLLRQNTKKQLEKLYANPEFIRYQELLKKAKNREDVYLVEIKNPKQRLETAKVLERLDQFLFK